MGIKKVFESIDEMRKINELKKQFNFSHIQSELSRKEIIELCENYDIICNSIQRLIETKQDDNFEERRNLLQDRIIVKLQTNPELMHLQKITQCSSIPNFSTTLGTTALVYNLDKVVEFILDDWHAGRMQDEQGLNLGMHCAEHQKEDLVIKALENIEAGVQQDNNGMNIGMHSAYNHLKEATKYALADPLASTQKDKKGNNIGMHYARWNPVTNQEDLKIILRAEENYIARLQENCFSQSIYTLAMRTMNPSLKAEFQREFDKICVVQTVAENVDNINEDEIVSEK